MTATPDAGSDEGLTVLVVDDSADIRDLLSIVLTGKSVGWRVVGEAGNGEEAVARAKETQPALVLLDIAMPVMDGMQALPLILEVAPDATIVLLSGFSYATAAEAARKAGAHGYVEKQDLVLTLVPRLRSIRASPWS